MVSSKIFSVRAFFAIIFALVCVFGAVLPVFAEVAVTSQSTTTTWVPTCTILTGNTKYGLSGSDVTHLQQFLIEQGYLASDLATGFFGSLTKAAVIQYQRAKSIDTTGFVGPITRAAISNQSCSGKSSSTGSGLSGSSGSSITVTPSTITSAQKIYINKFSTYSGGIGTVVTVYGSGFSATDNTVIFGTVAIGHIPSTDGKTLVFTVPDLSASCPTYSSTGCNVNGQPVSIRGSYDVYISNSYMLSSPIRFQMTSGTNSVDVNGVALSNKTPYISSVVGPQKVLMGTENVWTMVITDNYTVPVVATVSWGDATSSSQSVSLTLNKTQTLTFSHTFSKLGNYTIRFKVINDESGLGDTRDRYVTVVSSIAGNTNAPSLETLTPSSAKVGTTVLIQGSGFTAQNNSIHFGPGIISNVSSYNSGTSLLFTVPSYINPCDAVASGICNLSAVQITPSSFYNIYVVNGNGVSTRSVSFYVDK